MKTLMDKEPQAVKESQEDLKLQQMQIPALLRSHKNLVTTEDKFKDQALNHLILFKRVA